MEPYDSTKIETKWQQVWADENAFEVPNPDPDEAREQPKSYVLEMLPTRPITRCSALSRTAQVFTSMTSASSGVPVRT